VAGCGFGGDAGAVAVPAPVESFALAGLPSAAGVDTGSGAGEVSFAGLAAGFFDCAFICIPPYTKPFINLYFCLDNMILVAFSGTFS
jgi:hypothetical protein